ncbi:hypothetical protein JTB14_009923 [Gonioctena quinquepunctata]|nr:hypothetical protein JTB14_009923 [Gonioctena quinquepunctata]
MQAINLGSSQENSLNVNVPNVSSASNNSFATKKPPIFDGDSIHPVDFINQVQNGFKVGQMAYNNNNNNLLPNRNSKKSGIGQYQLQDDKLRGMREQVLIEDNVKKEFILHNDVLHHSRDVDEPTLLCVPTTLKEKFVEAYHIASGHYGSYKCWLVW